jgi:hypothetical protein
MPAPRDVHRHATRLLSAVVAVLGVAMVASTIARGGGPTAYGVVVGLLLTIAGAARFWLVTRAPQRR